MQLRRLTSLAPSRGPELLRPGSTRQCSSVREGGRLMLNLPEFYFCELHHDDKVLVRGAVFVHGLLPHEVVRDASHLHVVSEQKLAFNH